MYGANTYKEANKNYQTVLINIIQYFFKYIEHLFCKQHFLFKYANETFFVTYINQHI